MRHHQAGRGVQTQARSRAPVFGRAALWWVPLVVAALQWPWPGGAERRPNALAPLSTELRAASGRCIGTEGMEHALSPADTAHRGSSGGLSRAQWLCSLVSTFEAGVAPPPLLEERVGGGPGGAPSPQAAAVRSDGPTSRAVCWLAGLVATFEAAVSPNLLGLPAEAVSREEPPPPQAAAAPPSRSVLPAVPPRPLTPLRLLLLAAIAIAARRARGNKVTARTVLLILLYLFFPAALANQCSLAPTCSAYELHSGSSAKCTMKHFGHTKSFNGGGPVQMPGKGLYKVLKVSKDESNCCFDLEVQGFMCEVLKNGTAVRASRA